MVVTLTVLYMLMGVSFFENSTCVDGCYTDSAVLMGVSLTENSTHVDGCYTDSAVHVNGGFIDRKQYLC